MAEYKIGLDQAAWNELKDKLLRAKAPQEIDIALDEGSSEEQFVDTHDVKLQVMLEIIHLDVGQGESTLILLLCEPHLCRDLGESPCVLSILIDGGLTTDGGGIVMRTLRHYKITDLDVAAISHFDKDHTEGITRVIKEHSRSISDSQPESSLQSNAEQTTEDETEIADKAKAEAVNQPEETESEAQETSAPDTHLAVQKVILRKYPSALDRTTKVVEQLSNAIGNEQDGWLTVIGEGDTLVLDCDADNGLFKMTCSAVNRGEANGGQFTDDVENACSIAWLLEFGKYTYYTAGDLPSELRGAGMENDLARNLATYAPVTAVKCGHHGSKHSTSASFLDNLKPRFAFLSAGRQKGFGHPNSEVLLRLARSPGMETIFVTNCYYERPLVDVDYVAQTATILRGKLDFVTGRLTEWLNSIPVIAGTETSVKTTESRSPGLVRDMRSALDTLYQQVLALKQTLETEGDEPKKATLDREKAMEGKLSLWARKHMTALSRLKTGFQTTAGFRVGGITPADQDFKDTATEWNEAAVLAGQIKDAQETLAGLAGMKSPPKVHLAGRSGKLGNISMLLHGEDANSPDRTLWFYSEAGGWFTFAYHNTDPKPEVADIPEEYNEWVESYTHDAISFMDVPGSPGHFTTYVSERETNYKKRVHEKLDDDEEPEPQDEQTEASVKKKFKSALPEDEEMPEQVESNSSSLE